MDQPTSSSPALNVPKDDLRLALAELATPIGFEFTDDKMKNADHQFERTRRELKNSPTTARRTTACSSSTTWTGPACSNPRKSRGSTAATGCKSSPPRGWAKANCTARTATRDRSFLAIDELPPDDALAPIESYQPDGRFRTEAEAA